jgi:hypothetical protein
MASHSKVLNITRNCDLDKSQAVKRIQAGVAVWVDEGKSFRELDLREASELHEQRKMLGGKSEGLKCKVKSRLEPAEVNFPLSCVFEPPVRRRALAVLRQQSTWLREARKFFTEATAGL